MPFCGEVSCHGEDRRHSQTGHKDTKEGGKVHLNGSILFPAGAGCWLGLFERIFFYAVKSREQDALRTGRGFFFFFFLIHWVRSTVLSSHYIWIFFPGAARSHFEWKTKIFTHRIAQCEQFHGACRVVVWNPEKIYSCGYLSQACPWINSPTWMKNCGYWRTSTWCTSDRLRSVYRWNFPFPLVGVWFSFTLLAVITFDPNPQR